MEVAVYSKDFAKIYKEFLSEQVRDSVKYTPIYSGEVEKKVVSLRRIIIF